MNVLRSLGLHGHTGTDSAWLYDGAVSDEEAGNWLLRHGWDGYMLSPYIDYLSFFFHKKWRYPKKDIISLMVKMSDDSLGSSEKHAIHKKVTTDDRKRLLRGAGKCRDILARMGIPKEETFPGDHTTSMSGCTLYPYPSG